MPSDAPFFIGFVIIVLAFIALAIIAIVSCWQSPGKGCVRPRKASLPPLHWGYKPRQDGGGLQVNPNPPKAPKGSGGGSH